MYVLALDASFILVATLVYSSSKVIPLQTKPQVSDSFGRSKWKIWQLGFEFMPLPLSIILFYLVSISQVRKRNAASRYIHHSL